MSKRELMMPGEGVPQLLYSLTNCLEQRVLPHFRGTKLHWGLRRILQRLWLEDGLSQSELARAVRFSEASISNMLKHLVSGGWVERRTDSYDYRVTRVFLTQQGSDLRTAVKTELADVEGELRRLLPSGEVEKLAELLHQALDGLTRRSEATSDPETPTGIYDRAGPPGDL